jgi:hypothetical protein
MLLVVLSYYAFGGFILLCFWWFYLTMLLVVLSYYAFGGFTVYR